MSTPNHSETQPTMHNKVWLSGKLTERKALRHTPAGVPVSEAILEHESSQIEAELLRQIKMDVGVIAIGQNALWLNSAPLGSTSRCNGFLAPKSRHSKALTLHIQQIDFLEGN